MTDFADDLSRKASKQFARAQDMAGDVLTTPTLRSGETR